MKSWKFQSIGLIAIVFGFLMLNGCYDPCQGVTCINGECIEGVCECIDGYEGADCGRAYNQKIGGLYDLHEICFPSGEYDDNISITPITATRDQFLYRGMWADHSIDVLCTILPGGMEFTFGDTLLPTENRISKCVSGTISADGNRIDLIYKIYLPNESIWDDSCTTVLTR